MHHRQLKIAALLAWAAAVACQDVSVTGHEARGEDCPAGAVNYTQLATRLSRTAQIYLPGSDAFDAAVARWSNLSTPVANVVVVPSTEHDIVETVRLLQHPPLPPPEFPVTACLSSSHCLGQLRKPAFASFPHHQWRAWINHHAGENDLWNRNPYEPAE